MQRNHPKTIDMAVSQTILQNLSTQQCGAGEGEIVNKQVRYAVWRTSEDLDTNGAISDFTDLPQKVMPSLVLPLWCSRCFFYGAQVHPPHKARAGMYHNSPANSAIMPAKLEGNDQPRR